MKFFWYKTVSNRNDLYFYKYYLITNNQCLYLYKQSQEGIFSNYEDKICSVINMKIIYEFFIKPILMANIMCKLDWETMPRYLYKYYSGCFCKSVFEMRLTFASMDFE